MSGGFTSKKCYTCKKRKPTAEFCKNKNTADGCQSYCKECFNVRRRWYRAMRAERAAARGERKRVRRPGSGRHADFSYNPLWETLPSTAAEALDKGYKQFFTGKPCNRGHIAPRNALRSRCWICRTLENRARAAKRKKIIEQEEQGIVFEIDMKEKVEQDPEASHNFLLPPGCEPERVVRTLKMEEMERHYDCVHYIACCQFSWHGLTYTKISSWRCAESCVYRPAKLGEDHSVAYRRLPYPIKYYALHRKEGLEEHDNG